MKTENWRWLAAIIAAHPNHEVVGRTRLQKTIWLLQRVGMPTDYVYSLHFYGPYSEEVKADIAFAEQFGLISETSRRALDGTEYFILSAASSSVLPNVNQFREPLAILTGEQDSTVLELAATYDAFRKMGLNHEEARESLRAKKGPKCDAGREERAISLLDRLGLVVAA